jgi:hypothetical protein
MEQVVIFVRVRVCVCVRGCIYIYTRSRKQRYFTVILSQHFYNIIFKIK